MMDTITHLTTFFRQSDGYVVNYRQWGPATGEDVIVVLHGGMSHAGWQSPLGVALRARGDVTLIALDRRGSGLNLAQRGHLGSADRVVEDVLEVLRALSTSFRRVHLAGWCFGGQVAVVAAAAAEDGLIASLSLVAPGLYFDQRYQEVLGTAISSARHAAVQLGVVPAATDTYITLPLQPADFTEDVEWRRFVSDDDRKLTSVSDGTVEVSLELGARAEKDLALLADRDSVPMLAVIATRDRLVDVPRVRDVLRHCGARVEELATGHAVQFDEPDALAEHLLDFVRSTR